MLGQTVKTRLHIRSIENAGETADPAIAASERDNSFEPDEELAELFREMRQALDLSPARIAARLGTDLETIGLLERGHLSALPPWNETSRILRDYTGLLGLDAEPVLRRVMLQLPGDHPLRPRTQSFEPCYENLRANVDAAMNRVPGSQTPVENSFLPIEYDAAVSRPVSDSRPTVSAGQLRANGGLATRLQKAGSAGEGGHSAGFGEMRAVPPDPAAPFSKSSVSPVADRGKKGVFVLLIQILLLLILVGGGYVFWLSLNDPQGYEKLEMLAVTGWRGLLEQVGPLLKF